MKINVKNRKKVEQAINDAQKKARVRLIDYDSVTGAVKSVEARLNALLMKKDWIGLKITVDTHAGVFPGSYRGTPESTYFVLERCASGWFIVTLERGATGTVIFNPFNLADKKDEMARFVTHNF